MESKVNQLLKQWPPGTVAASPWLVRQGVSRQLARRYTASGWLQPLGRGAFIRAGEPALEWFGALYALQTQLGLTVHPAAAGRVYAAYGGVYVATAIAWLWLVEGVRPTPWDLAGSAVALAGMLIIVWGWRQGG